MLHMADGTAELLNALNGGSSPAATETAPESADARKSEAMDPISVVAERGANARAKEAFESLGGDDDDAPEAAEEAIEADPEAEPKKPVEDDADWGDDLYQPAYDAGMTREDLRAMPPATRTRLLMSLGRPAPDKAEKKAEPEAPIGPTVEEFTAVFGEDFDEETSKKLGPKLHKLLAPMFEKQAKAEQAAAKHVEESERREFISRLNSAFATLPDAERQYGKGEWSSLDQQHRENRGMVFDIADLLVAGARARGRGLSPDQAIRVGHAFVSLPQLKQHAREDVAAKLQQRTSARSIAPSHSRAGKQRELTGMQAFRADVAKIVGQ